jgi:hypothetical protein
MSSKQIKLELRRGVSVRGVRADTIVAELERIAGLDDGSLTASSVLDASRPKDAPLHPVFEWDNKKAAENYRLQQANTVIRCVTIKHDSGENVPVWQHVPSEVKSDAGRYLPTPVVIARPDLFMSALTHLQARVNEAKESLAALQFAAQNSGHDDDRMARIGIAVQAMQMAHAAVQALH